MPRARSVLIVLGCTLGAWSLAARAETATLYVTNTKSDSISIIDTTTFEVTGTIPLGKGKPNRIAFHPDGKTAWVVYDKSRDLGIVDAEARRLVKRVKIGGNPYNLTFTPDGRYLYVLDWSSDTSNDEIIIYDLRAERVDGRIEVSTWPAHGIFTRDGRTFYVSGETAGDLSIIDTAARKIVTRLWTGGDAMGLALTADERTLYAGAGEEKKVIKVDTATAKAVGAIPVPGIVHETTLTLDGQFLYVTLRKANKIAVVRTADDKVVAIIPQPSYPDLVLMEPTGRHAFVTNRYADVVTVIDVKTHTQVNPSPPLVRPNSSSQNAEKDHERVAAHRTSPPGDPLSAAPPGRRRLLRRTSCWRPEVYRH
jgi:YVTN family beta-propeller protein